MDFRHLSDGIHLHMDQHGYGALAPSWPSIGSSLHSVIDTGDNSAGNGGNGYFFGSLQDTQLAIFNPVNIALAGSHGTAGAFQSNSVHFDQSAIQIAGVGGDGGNGNASIGGNASAFGFGNSLLHSGMISSGGNQVGNGGDGYFHGTVVHLSFVLYEPINIAVAGYGSSAEADQTNNVDFNQSAVQMAGIGGNGGSDNAAIGGNVSSGFGSSSGVIDTGTNGAGNGGDGHFYGSLVDALVVIYMPINIAIAGYNSTAEANQSNTASFDQSATQIAGVGGNGGNGNMTMGGSVSASGFGSSWFDSGTIWSGGNQAGNGGNGEFHGSLVHAAFVLYDPVNIAMAGPNGTAEADQINNADINQSSIQMAGIGGNGGNGNAAIGGTTGFAGSGFGSDAINTGHNEAGNGGAGHFSGNLIDASVATFNPINIAMAAYHSIADALQINNVDFNQSAIQIAGVGGNGGLGNLAFGGDIAAHLVPEHHLLLG